MSRLLSSPVYRSRRARSLALAVVVLFAIGFGWHSRLWAYLLKDSRWPSNAEVVMYLQLGSSGTLIDGNTSWGASAEDALSIWNGNLGSGVKFTVVRDATIPQSENDRKNSVFFDDNVFGDAFGSDTLAITLRRYSNNTTLEADVIFNTAKSFNSYRGPLRQSSGGGTLNDFHRVALHEFGHVLGLGHPDDAGQRVVAIMNSHSSDTDALQADDLAGIQAIYGTDPQPTPTPSTRPVVSVVGTPSRGGFVVSRTGGTTSALVVPFHNGGSAVVDQDYRAFTGSLALPAGQSEAVIPVTLLPGANRNHKVKVFLDPGAGYDIGKTQSKVFLSDLP